VNTAQREILVRALFGVAIACIAWAAIGFGGQVLRYRLVGTPDIGRAIRGEPQATRLTFSLYAGWRGFERAHGIPVTIVAAAAYVGARYLQAAGKHER
jgi:hypothetical protein